MTNFVLGKEPRLTKLSFTKSPHNVQKAWLILSLVLGKTQSISIQISDERNHVKLGVFSKDILLCGGY